MRKALSKKVRFEVFKRDGFKCQYCGSMPPEIPLEVDHIIPVSKGGDNDFENLITACFDCNRGKSNVDLNSLPDRTIQKIELKSLAQKQYKEFKALRKKEAELIKEQIDDVEEIFRNIFPDRCFTEKFRLSVKKFINELGVFDVITAMEIACSRKITDPADITTYFCGICWRKIRQD